MSYVLKTQIFSSIRVFFTGQQRKGGDQFYFSLPLSTTNEHYDIYLQLCRPDYYLVVLTTSHVITTVLLNEVDPPSEFFYILGFFDLPFIYRILLIDFLNSFSCRKCYVMIPVTVYSSLSCHCICYYRPRELAKIRKSCVAGPCNFWQFLEWMAFISFFSKETVIYTLLHNCTLSQQKRISK